MAKAGEGGFVCMPCDADEEKWRFNDFLVSTDLLCIGSVSIYWQVSFMVYLN